MTSSKEVPEEAVEAAEAALCSFELYDGAGCQIETYADPTGRVIGAIFNVSLPSIRPALLEEFRERLLSDEAVGAALSTLLEAEQEEQQPLVVTDDLRDCLRAALDAALASAKETE